MAKHKSRKQAGSVSVTSKPHPPEEVQQNSSRWPLIVGGSLLVSVVGGVLCAFFPSIRPIAPVLFLVPLGVALYSVNR